MKRLLLTVTFLIFPTAAIGEIYFCESTHSTVLGYGEDGPVSIGVETDDYSFIVDTTQGFRRQINAPEAQQRPEYVGSCFAEVGSLIGDTEETVNCKNGHDTDFVFENFSLNKEEVTIFPNLAFWYVSITIVNINAVQGFCQKA